MKLTVYTHEQVVARIEKFCDRYKFYAEAARAMGCTKSQLTVARLGQQPPCPAILKAIGLERAPLYVSGLDEKYKEGP